MSSKNNDYKRITVQPFGYTSKFKQNSGKQSNQSSEHFINSDFKIMNGQLYFKPKPCFKKIFWLLSFFLILLLIYCFNKKFTHYSSNQIICFLFVASFIFITYFNLTYDSNL